MIAASAAAVLIVFGTVRTLRGSGSGRNAACGASLMRRVTVLGAGSWGTALAVHLGRIGHDVRLWARDLALASDIAKRRANAVYLPDISLPASVTVTDALAEALFETELIVSAIPSHGCRAVMRSSAPFVAPRATIVSATKGLESETLLRMSEVIAEELGWDPRSSCCRVRALRLRSRSGCQRQSLPPRTIRDHRDGAGRVQGTYSAFTVPLTWLAGAGRRPQNIIAIAAGVVEGLGLGHNARGAHHAQARGDLEACGRRGGRRETPSGLSGLGDLVLTYAGSLSRNRHVGIEWLVAVI